MNCETSNNTYELYKSRSLHTKWRLSIPDIIDRQLYAKYGLTDDEIAFIEKTIKPME